MATASETAVAIAAVRGPPRNVASMTGANSNTSRPALAENTAIDVPATMMRPAAASSGRIGGKPRLRRRSIRISMMGRPRVAPSTLDVIQVLHSDPNGLPRLQVRIPLWSGQVMAVKTVATAVSRSRPPMLRIRVGKRKAPSTAAVAMICATSTRVTRNAKRAVSPKISSSAMCNTLVIASSSTPCRRFRISRPATRTALAVQIVGRPWVTPARNRL